MVLSLRSIRRRREEKIEPRWVFFLSFTHMLVGVSPVNLKRRNVQTQQTSEKLTITLHWTSGGLMSFQTLCGQTSRHCSSGVESRNCCWADFSALFAYANEVICYNWVAWLALGLETVSHKRWLPVVIGSSGVALTLSSLHIKPWSTIIAKLSVTGQTRLKCRETPGSRFFQYPCN